MKMSIKQVGPARADNIKAGLRGCEAGRVIVSALIVATLAACSETSLNDAPIVDLSARASARAASAKPPAMAIPGSSGEVLYTVQKGDTLFHLASNCRCTTQDLARWNGIDEHAPIFIGQQLRFQAAATGDQANPVTGATATSGAADTGGAASTEAVATPIAPAGGSAYETRTLEAPLAPLAPAPASTHGGDSVMAGSTAPAAVAAPAIAANGASSAAGANGDVATPSGVGSPPPVPVAPTTAPAIGASAAMPGPASAATAGWIWPVDGPVTGKFDPLRGKGIEIAAPEDAPVVAVADGTVSYTGSPRDYGNLIILKHGDELLSVYAHNKTLLVKEGATVRRGQTIATAGKSANVPSTLHFEVRRNHVAIDPLDVLPLR
jgi:lipoprotein NlpD